jgi:hypothetical protein
MDNSSDSDRAEFISDFHLAFMRSYCEWEERLAKATVERFPSERKHRADALTLNEVKRLESSPREVVRHCGASLQHSKRPLDVI